MSLANVNAFISHWDGQDPSQDPAMKDPDPGFIVDHAKELGFRFSEEDLKSALNTRICNAESLPRPWGWSVARKMGLVRN